MLNASIDAVKFECDVVRIYKCTKRCVCVCVYVAHFNTFTKHMHSNIPTFDILVDLVHIRAQFPVFNIHLFKSILL